MTFLILHGIQGRAGMHWQQWLHNELVKRGHRVIMPEMPEPNHPDRREWLYTAVRLLKDVDPADLVIVGHSLGVATALDYIEQSPATVKALIAVSGFAEDYGAELNSYFMKGKRIDFNTVLAHLEQAHVLYGDNDPYVPQHALKDLAQKLHVQPIIMAGGGHLNTDAGYTEFPALLEIIETL